MRILLIEDRDEDAYVSIRSLQKDAPASKITWAKSLDEARSVLETTASDFDVVLVDRHLPGGLGTDLAESLRTSPQTRHAKKVVVTSDGTSFARADALAKDFDAYLTKPISQARLRQIVVGDGAYWNIADLPTDLSLYRQARQNRN